MRELSFLVSLLVLLRYLICSRGFGLSSSPWESKQNVNVNPDDSSLKVESMSIHSLEDHENEAIRMAASLNLWLDREWMALDVHNEIANTVRDSYIEARNANEHEVRDILPIHFVKPSYALLKTISMKVSVIMFKVAGDLEMKWTDFEQKGAFTNAWDVANYVSDYLAYRIGVQGCECSAKIIEP